MDIIVSVYAHLLKMISALLYVMYHSKLPMVCFC